MKGRGGQGCIVYICTSGMLMRRKMGDYLAGEFYLRPNETEPLLQRLLDERLMTPAEAEQVTQGPKDSKKPVISPYKWMYLNAHLHGLEKLHDIIVEREDEFRECILAIPM